MRDSRITLAHGSGGLAMERLIREVFLETFDDPELARLEDQAKLEFPSAKLAFTTDAYVVDPLFFPGGDIGKLAVCGTVNDLVVGGAQAQYLSCSFILEEGLGISLLENIVRSMKTAAGQAGIRIVTGDTKVVPKGAVDKLFISTAGVGVIPTGLELGMDRILPGDRILVSGPVGDHGAAVLDARGELSLTHAIVSDCRPLGPLVQQLLEACCVHTMRDPTRGGLAAVLNEYARATGLCLRIREDTIPVNEPVRGMCELLGLDPLYLACEGRMVAVVPEKEADAALAALQRHSDGLDAALIGEVTDSRIPQVILHTALGGERILDQPEGDPLPRIC